MATPPTAVEVDGRVHAVALTAASAGASRKRAGADDAEAAAKKPKAVQQMLSLYVRAWKTCQFTYDDFCATDAAEGVAEEELAAAWARLVQRAKVDGELELDASEEATEEVEWEHMADSVEEAVLGALAAGEEDDTEAGANEDEGEAEAEADDAHSATSADESAQ